jgi:hypothetical protein
MPTKISDHEKKQIYERTGSSYYIELARYELAKSLTPYIIERRMPSGNNQHLTISDISQ